MAKMAKKNSRKVGFFNTDYKIGMNYFNIRRVSHINVTLIIIQSFSVIILGIMGVCQASNIITRIIIPILYTTKCTS